MAPSRLYRAEGIVIKRRNVGEADRIVTVMTRQYGKLRLLAKGIRRITSRRSVHLEVFSNIRVLIHKGHTFDTVTEVTSISSFPKLRKDLRAVGLAYYVCELVDVLMPERQEHTDVYELLLSSLWSLERGEVRSFAADHVAARLLTLLGYLPKGGMLPVDQIRLYIERIIEKRLRTPKLLTKVLGNL